MSRLDKPADFSAFARDMLILCYYLAVTGTQIVTEVILGPSRHDVIRERLSTRFRSTYHDRTRSYALRESEIFALGDLGNSASFLLTI